MSVLKVTHNAGYFSNMTIRLISIMEYMKSNGQHPDEVDSSEQFEFYKDNYFQNLIPYYIQHNYDPIKFKLPKQADVDCMAIQWDDYRKLDFKALKLLMGKYFLPGEMVRGKLDFLKEKYNLGEYISVFYRGNGKYVETEIASYDNFFKKAEQIRKLEPNLPFLVMPDECRFLAEFKRNFNNVLSFEETPCIDDNTLSVTDTIPLGKKAEYGAIFNASTILMGQGKHLITHSGNCGLWASLYRGHSKGIHQINNNKWYE